MKRRSFLVLAAALLSACATPEPRRLNASSAPSAIEDLRPTLILISIDGFRADYLDREAPPVLSLLARKGVRAQGLRPVFPTLTFPNHYTIATGLYPQHHGITSNTMVDPAIERRFQLSDVIVDDTRWWQGEPIWVTAEKQGQKAGTMFWPGTSAEIAGVRPTYWHPYQGSVPSQARVERVLSWLDLPVERRPTFLTLYFDTVDGAGHTYGPDSLQLRAAVGEVDASLGLLVEGLRSRGIEDKVHIVLTSDHGMAAVDPSRVENLDRYVKLEEGEIVGYGAVVGIQPRAGREDAIYAALKGKSRRFQIYRKSEIPAEFHYSDHVRIPSLVLLAEEGAYIRPKAGTASKGAHGYHPQLTSMLGVFVATGPLFRTGVRIPTVEGVHIYSLIAHVLGLKPAANDGNLDGIRAVLR